MDNTPASGVDEHEKPRSSGGVNGKDSRAVMDVAVFRLSKRFSRAGETIRYELPDGYLEVSAGPAGMASIWDYDLVLMLVSQVTEAMNRYRAGKGAKPGRVLRPRVTEILKFCRRERGGARRDDLVATCLRLNTTHIAMVRRARTKAGRVVRVAEGEPLISRYRIVLNDAGKPESIEIEMAAWMHREITAGRTPNVLTVHPDYFRIKLGIGRFVYRLARRTAGAGEARWLFKTVYEHSGSAGAFKEFCRILRRLIKMDDLPEYGLAEGSGQSGALLIMARRKPLSVVAGEPD